MKSTVPLQCIVSHNERSMERLRSVVHIPSSLFVCLLVCFLKLIRFAHSFSIDSYINNCFSPFNPNSNSFKFL